MIPIEVVTCVTIKKLLVPICSKLLFTKGNCIKYIYKSSFPCLTWLLQNCLLKNLDELFFPMKQINSILLYYNDVIM